MYYLDNTSKIIARTAQHTIGFNVETKYFLFSI